MKLGLVPGWNGKAQCTRGWMVWTPQGQRFSTVFINLDKEVVQDQGKPSWSQGRWSP